MLASERSYKAGLWESVKGLEVRACMHACASVCERLLRTLTRPPPQPLLSGCRLCARSLLTRPLPPTHPADPADCHVKSEEQVRGGARGEGGRGSGERRLMWG